MKEEEIEFFETRIPILRRHYALVSEFNGQINEEETKKLFIYIRQLQKDNRKLQQENKSLQSQLKAKEEVIKEARELIKDCEWRLDDVHDLINGYNELDEILSKGENK